MKGKREGGGRGREILLTPSRDNIFNKIKAFFSFIDETLFQKLIIR